MNRKKNLTSLKWYKMGCLN